MNGIPERIDATLLVGATLFQVCVGENEVILRFDNETSVMLECEVGVAVAGMAAQKTSRAILTGSAMLALLGTKVIEITRRSPEALTVRFERDVIVTLHDSNAHYESFSIMNGGRQIVV